MKRKTKTSGKTVSLNRKARFDYSILKTLETGIALKGTEIKSIREGSISIREAYIRPINGELWLVGCHIAHYKPAGMANHDLTRNRKLLLHRKEIKDLSESIKTENATLIPLRLYLKKGIAKLEIALAKGKRHYDKRAAIAKREADRQMQRALKHRS